MAHWVRNIAIYFIKGSAVHVVVWVVKPYSLVSEEYTALIFRAVSCQCTFRDVHGIPIHYCDV